MFGFVNKIFGTQQENKAEKLSELVGHGKSVGVLSVDLGRTYLTLSLKEYGYASAEWSVGHANSLLETIKSITPMPFEGNPSLIDKVKTAKGFSAQLIFIGFYAAAYSTYVCKSLQFNYDPASVTELTEGICEGLLALRWPTDNGLLAVSQFQQNTKNMVGGLLFKSFSQFSDAMMHDYDLPDLKNEKTFITAMSFFNQIYPTVGEFSLLEQMTLQPIIQGAPVHLFAAINENHVTIGGKINKHKVRLGGKIRIQIPDEIL
jgi:hypothetical protein